MNTIEFKKMLIDKGIDNLEQLQTATKITKPTLISYQKGIRKPTLNAISKIIVGLNLNKKEIKKIFPELNVLNR